MPNQTYKKVQVMDPFNQTLVMSKKGDLNNTCGVVEPKAMGKPMAFINTELCNNSKTVYQSLQPGVGLADNLSYRNAQTTKA